jgi:hypothetical protein
MSRVNKTHGDHRARTRARRARQLQSRRSNREAVPPLSPCLGDGPLLVQALLPPLPQGSGGVSTAEGFTRILSGLPTRQEGSSSPFHFGARAPTPTPAVDTRNAFNLQSPASYGSGSKLVLPALQAPDIPSAKDVWFKAIDGLSTLQDANLKLLNEARDHIAGGVKLGFSGALPPPRMYNNTQTFLRNASVCKQRLDEYIALGALRSASAPPPPGGYPYCQPLHAVLRPGKKPRIVVDLGRNLNDYLPDAPFKYSTVQDSVRLSQAFSTPAWYVKLDISSCFLSFPIDPGDVPFYRCRGARGEWLEFTSMVFGLKPAPRIASLLLDVVSATLTNWGVSHVQYLDDFLLVADSREAAEECARVATKVLAMFGLALSTDKTEGPSQVIEFLGIIINSIEQTLSISSGRKKELLDILGAFSKRERSSCTRVQSLLGKLSFAATVLPGARPFTRRIIDLLRRNYRLSNIILDPPFQKDVSYWRDHIGAWNGRQKWRASAAEPCVFGSDASTEGFGYGLESAPKSVVSRLHRGMRPGNVRAGVWSSVNGDAARQQSSSNIAWGEMFCTVAAVSEYGADLRDQHIVFVIDNESDVSVINRQRSREPRVCGLLRSLCDLSLRHNFSFNAVHRSGVDNELMDWASRPSIHRFDLNPEAAHHHVVHARARRPHAGPTEIAHNYTHIDTHQLYPALSFPLNVCLINSRCISFGKTQPESADWSSNFGGWPASPAPSTWPPPPRRRTRDLSPSS